jgi:hypothetical protein
MERLAARLISLSIPDLLDDLYGRPTRLRSTVRACPEAQLALTVTLERLQPMRQAAPETPAAPLASPVNFSETPVKSMNYNTHVFQKTF